MYILWFKATFQTTAVQERQNNGNEVKSELVQYSNVKKGLFNHIGVFVVIAFALVDITIRKSVPIDLSLQIVFIY